MRLRVGESPHEVDCRQVVRQFAAGARCSPSCRSPSPPARRCCVTGAERRRQDHAAAHDRRLAAARRGPHSPRGRRRLSAALGEQCHYVGHLNAVKASLTVEENAAFWCRFLGGAARCGSTRRSRPSGWPRCATFRPATCRPGRSGGWALRALLLAERPLWLLDEPTASLDERRAGRCWPRAVNAHLAARRPGGRGDACAARLRQRRASCISGGRPHAA